MINWKQKKLFKNNSWFDKISLIRESMVDELVSLNKTQKLFKGEFAYKKYWKTKPTEIILLSLNGLLNNKK